MFPTLTYMGYLSMRWIVRPFVPKSVLPTYETYYWSVRLVGGTGGSRTFWKEIAASHDYFYFHYRGIFSDRGGGGGGGGGLQPLQIPQIYETTMPNWIVSSYITVVNILHWASHARGSEWGQNVRPRKWEIFAL